MNETIILIVLLLVTVAQTISNSLLVARLRKLEQRVRKLEPPADYSGISVNGRDDTSENWQLWSVGKMND